MTETHSTNGFQIDGNVPTNGGGLRLLRPGSLWALYLDNTDMFGHPEYLVTPGKLMKRL